MISGLYTALLLIVFLAIVAWAYSKHNKSTFKDMGSMALREDGDAKNSGNSDNNNKAEVNHE